LKALLTITAVIGADHLPGDYAYLHSNGGAGEIDWDTPADPERIELFPGGAGIFGFGHAPFGHHRFGHAHSIDTIGFGHLPFGHFPFGHGATRITAELEVTTCGSYTCGFKCYDAAGNPHSGTPDEVTTVIHIAPDSPAGLKLNDYNKTTDVLTLAPL